MFELTQQVAVTGKKFTEIQALCYACFEELRWTVEYAVENVISGYSQIKRSIKEDAFKVSVEEGGFSITSGMQNKRKAQTGNQENIDRFIDTFNRLNEAIPSGELNDWLQRLRQKQYETRQLVAKAEKEEAEVEAVMHLSQPPAITYGLIALNVLVFVVMAVMGVGLFEPTTESLLQWGGNEKFYTAGGDWWRLISSIFVHAGLVHVLFNMYALYMVGIFLEPMLGKLRYLVAYLATGILSSVASIWWHNEPIVSVGGNRVPSSDCTGVFLALLLSNFIPQKMRKALLQSIGVFVGYNLLYGLAKTGIDNSAHIGGLVSGFAFGYVYLYSLRKVSVKPFTVAIGVMTISIAIAGFYLANAKDDSTIFQKNIHEFSLLEEKALSPMSDDKLTPEERVKRVKEISLPGWEAGKRYLVQSASLDLSEAQQRQRAQLEKYTDLRIRESKEMINGESIDQSENEIKILLKEISEEGKK